MWEDTKKILKENINSLALLGVVLVLAFIYFYFFAGEDRISPLTREDRVDSSEIGREIFEEIERLQRLDQIDLSIINDPIVSEMNDIRRSVGMPAPGRPNPFAPF